MLKIRLARGGAKKKPFYQIVLADSRSPRDGAFLEKLGTYNPMLPKDNADRVTLKGERIQFWISKGAQVTDRVAIFLGKAGLAPMPAQKQNLEKAKPKAKAVERVKEQAQKAEKLKAAAEEAANAAKAPAAEEAAEAPAEAAAE